MLGVSDPVQWLLPGPLYLAGLLVAGAVLSWFRHSAILYRWRYILSILGIWAYLGTTPAVAHLLVAYLERGYSAPVLVATPRPALIVVLGSGYLQRGAVGSSLRLGEPGWERVHTAVSLWRREEGRLLFVGGPPVSGGGAGAPAANMARVAIELGVPPEVIGVEERSQNTYENIQFSSAVITKHKGTVWLVTSAMHMDRARAVAEKQGLKVEPFAGDFRAEHRLGWKAWFPNSGSVPLFTAALHEIIGLIAYQLRGWT